MLGVGEAMGVILLLVFVQSLTFKGKVTNSLKFKEKTTELDTRSYKCLLLALVKLIHADPKLMLHVSPPPPRRRLLFSFASYRSPNARGLLCFPAFQNPVKQAPEMQSSTAELITGLVQLVPLTNSTQLSQEAMEVSASSHSLIEVFWETGIHFLSCAAIAASVENSFSFSCFKTAALFV